MLAMATIVHRSHVDVVPLGRRSCAALPSSSSDDDSLRYTDADCGGIDSSEDDHRHQQRRCSTESSGTEIVGVNDKGRRSSVSECSVDVVDLESGVVEETKVHLAKLKSDCRICHLSFDGSNLESGIPIELGCSCKDDLAAAHKHCAEAWFKIRGNNIQCPSHVGAERVRSVGQPHAMLLGQTLNQLSTGTTQMNLM